MNIENPQADDSQEPKFVPGAEEITIDLPEAEPNPMKLEMAEKIQKSFTPEDIDKLKAMGPKHEELDPVSKKNEAVN